MRKERVQDAKFRLFKARETMGGPLFKEMGYRQEYNESKDFSSLQLYQIVQNFPPHLPKCVLQKGRKAKGYKILNLQGCPAS